MKLYGVALIAWILLQSSAWTTDAAVRTFTLDLARPTAAKYSSFLDQIRNNMRDPRLKYCSTEIAVIKAPSVADKFLRINFQGPRGTVSLGLARVNLYVVAYFAVDNRNVNRAYYFRTEINSAELRTVFPEVTVANQRPLEYTEDYQSIEKNAKITTGDKSRKELGLGIDLLISTIDKVNKKVRVVKDEARFLLIGIQMSAEAVRFRYIQNLVTRNFPKKFNSDNTVIQYQTSWGKISEAIHSDCKNGKFNKDYNFGFGNVRLVKDFHMGLLMHLGPPKSFFEANSTGVAPAGVH
uniref:rRNA N-glycosylase n=1 Tax=Dianthus chinensis TaxID=118431 RepID=Q93Y64_9CARY|nr:ribosome inactivating protein 3 precursor [Dianthus chinensis]